MSSSPYPQYRKDQKSAFFPPHFLGDPELTKTYNSVCQHSQKLLKVDPLAVEFMRNQDKSIKDNGIVFLKTKGLGCVEDVLNITFASIVSVKVEEGKEVFDLFGGEDWVFCYDVLGKNGGSLFLNDLFPVNGGHLDELIYFL